MVVRLRVGVFCPSVGYTSLGFRGEFWTGYRGLSTVSILVSQTMK